MDQQQCPQDHDIIEKSIVTNLKNINVKYTTSNQFYPKTKLKIKTKQIQEINKLKDLRQISKSSYSKDHQSDSLGNCLTAQIYKQQNKKPSTNHSSFTMKVIEHHIQAQQSNLIGKHARNKMSRLYDQIQQINGKQERLYKKYAPHYSERLNQKPRQNEICQNTQDQSVNQLYKSLPQPFINKKQLSSFENPGSSISYFKSRVNNTLVQKKKYSDKLTQQLRHLQINVGKQRNQSSISEMIQQLTKINNNVTSILQSSLNRKNRYKKKKLQPLKVNNNRDKMSNNIKDYLSVERIQIKEIQEQLLSETTNSVNPIKGLQKQSQFDLSLNRKNASSKKQRKPYSTVGPNTYSQIRTRTVKFNPPFELYYYRDFIWKVAFSNEFIIEAPVQYENKIKVYLGKGNNSNLIRGLIRRRPWYQITQKYQEAQFIWTQIKMQAVFSLQKKNDKKIEYHTLDSPLIEAKKTALPNQILNDYEKIKFSSYWGKNYSKQMKFKECLKNRSKLLNLKQTPVSSITLNMKIHNHFRNNYVIGNKKALFSLMNNFYTVHGQQVFNYLPLTFHIKNGLQDDEYLKFLQYFYSISKEIKKLQDQQLKSYIYKHNAWIVKPGENTNRGNGIIVCLNLNEVKAILKKKQKHNDGTNKTYILQKYIQKPLLYKRRKFDLRHYMLMSCTNGIVKGYWYKQGYVRTTSAQYTLKFNSGSVHLTNDAVQKQLPDYGRFQKGNKISYQELNEFIKKSDSQFDFQTLILPKMKKIATDLIKASAKLMDPQKKQNNFQIFGLDFMIDQAYNVWLIECNSNPCLELSCPLLGRIIPKMVQNTFRICIDPIFVPPTSYIPKCQQYYQNINQQNNFQLVYDQRTDNQIKQNQKNQNDGFLENKEFQQDDDTFDDDGQAWDD